MEKPRMLFPRSFGSFLFPLLATMHAGQGAGDLDPQTPSNGAGAGAGADAKGIGAHGNGRAVRSPDARLELIVRSYGRAMRELAGMPDPEGHALLQAALRGGTRFYRHEPPTATAGEREGTRKDERGADYVGNDDSKERRCQNFEHRRTESGLETGRVDSNLTALMERTRWALWRRKAWHGGVGCRVFCFFRCCTVEFGEHSPHQYGVFVFRKEDEYGVKTDEARGLLAAAPHRNLVGFLSPLSTTTLFVGSFLLQTSPIASVQVAPLAVAHLP